MPAATQSVFQLHITLEEVAPPIWRRLLVPGAIRLDRLHDMFQTAMGWTDSHLHQFRVGDDVYGMQDEDAPEEEEDEAAASVAFTIGRVGRFHYDYDFGDGWEHEVVVEDIAWCRSTLKYAVCLDGKRACPPEDVGGPFGYSHFLDVLANPAHEEHDHLVRWSGGEFDPEHFSVAATNTALQRLRTR